VTLPSVIAGLDVYVVGGAVRDALLNMPVGDRDWVVVGATPEEMVKRGFTPVGGDFPVFLHPKTHEEYALARTERKSGRGYHGFTFYTGQDVTLEQDLQRRDLTVNAMARSSQGDLIDPLNGLADLKAGIFRHVGLTFKEDPVRILRLSRFLARFTEFNVAPETQQLCEGMVQSGEVNALVSERVWQEIVKGMRASKPSRMFTFLQACGAHTVIMPELVLTKNVLNKIDQINQSGLTVEVADQYAALTLDSPDRQALSQRLKVPREVNDAARLLAFIIHDYQLHATTDAVKQLERLERCDALRRPERFIRLSNLAAWVLGVKVEPLLTALKAAQSVNAGEIAHEMGHAPEKIRQAIYAARLDMIRLSLH
jgi:tRNA nucleotidyltransferase (CCA-adding enzyme)